MCPLSSPHYSLIPTPPALAVFCPSRLPAVAKPSHGEDIWAHRRTLAAASIYSIMSEPSRNDVKSGTTDAGTFTLCACRDHHNQGRSTCHADHHLGLNPRRRHTRRPTGRSTRHADHHLGLNPRHRHTRRPTGRSTRHADHHLGLNPRHRHTRRPTGRSTRHADHHLGLNPRHRHTRRPTGRSTRHADHHLGLNPRHRHTRQPTGRSTRHADHHLGLNPRHRPTRACVLSRLSARASRGRSVRLRG